MEEMIGKAVVYGLLVLFLLIPIYVPIRIVQGRRKQKRLLAQRIESNESGAKYYFAKIDREGLHPIPVDIVLRDDEQAVLGAASTLYETRSVRVAGGAGTTVKGIHIGGGLSESHDRVREIDSGSLILTTERLVFDGNKENRTLKLADVMSVSAGLDYIEVSTTKRQKSSMYTVENPLVWREMVMRMAKKS